MTLTRKVTIDAPVDYRIATMVHFVKMLEKSGRITFTPAPFTDDQLVDWAATFWDSQHGEDD